MEAVIKVVQSSSDVRWRYDEEADVLYLSLGEPKSAEGVDVGGGIVVRYDEERGEVVGLTVIGLRDRLLEELGQENRRRT